MEFSVFSMLSQVSATIDVGSISRITIYR